MCAFASGSADWLHRNFRENPSKDITCSQYVLKFVRFRSFGPAGPTMQRYQNGHRISQLRFLNSALLHPVCEVCRGGSAVRRAGRKPVSREGLPSSARRSTPARSQRPLRTPWPRYCFLDFRLFPTQLIDIIDVRFPRGTTSPLSERCLDTVSNGGLLQPLVRPVLRVRSGGIWNGVSFQVRPRMPECVLRRQ